MSFDSFLEMVRNSSRKQEFDNSETKIFSITSETSLNSQEELNSASKESENLKNENSNVKQKLNRTLLNDEYLFARLRDKCSQNKELKIENHKLKEEIKDLKIVITNLYDQKYWSETNLINYSERSSLRMSGLDITSDEAGIRKFLGCYGKVLEVRLSRDLNSNGKFATVDFDGADSAKKAKHCLDLMNIKGFRCWILERLD